MSRDQQRLNDYITHILQAIERIYRYTEDIDENRLSAKRHGAGCRHPQH